VTATAVVGERRFECSQAGVFEAEPSGPRLLADPGFRPFALAGRAATAQRAAVLLVGGGKPAQSGELALLDLDGRVTARRHVAEDVVYAVALAPVDDQAAAACADGVVRLLHLPDLAVDPGWQPTSWRHARPAVAVAFSPDGMLLASGGHDGVILLGKPGAQSPQALLDHTAAVTCLLWTPDGRLASGAPRRQGAPARSIGTTAAHLAATRRADHAARRARRAARVHGGRSARFAAGQCCARATVRPCSSGRRRS
jgi:hypothetical protein